MVGALNRRYLAEPALWQRDATSEGFRWIDAGDADANVLSFLRFPDDGEPLACIANLSPVCREGYRVGLPGGGRWREVLNTDDEQFAGSGVGNGVVDTLDHGLPFSVELTLPLPRRPLAQPRRTGASSRCASWWAGSPTPSVASSYARGVPTRSHRLRLPRALAPDGRGDRGLHYVAILAVVKAAARRSAQSATPSRLLPNSRP